MMNPLKMAKLKQALASEGNILVCFIFGSEAMGIARAASDVDIALLLKEVLPSEKRLSLKLKVANKLSCILGREIDLVILNNAGNLLKYQVVSKGKLIFERHKGLAKKFKLNSVKEYFDYLPTFEFHYERLKEKAHG
jgi:predicted nucleotidyltransferase